MLSLCHSRRSSCRKKALDTLEAIFKEHNQPFPPWVKTFARFVLENNYFTANEDQLEPAIAALCAIYPPHLKLNVKTSL